MVLIETEIRCSNCSCSKCYNDTND